MYKNYLSLSFDKAIIDTIKVPNVNIHNRTCRVENNLATIPPHKSVRAQLRHTAFHNILRS